jgi:hypothetical protein
MTWYWNVTASRQTADGAMGQESLGLSNQGYRFLLRNIFVNFTNLWTWVIQHLPWHKLFPWQKTGLEWLVGGVRTGQGRWVENGSLGVPYGGSGSPVEVKAAQISLGTDTVLSSRLTGQLVCQRARVTRRCDSQLRATV